VATLTVTIDPEILEAAKREAERRQTTLEQFVIERLRTLLSQKPEE
jgi:predicted HicB family RNase H-like nuclease